MPHFLVKEEPTHYAYADLAREGATEWSGVHNPTALIHLRAIRRGDQGLYYHSGSVRAAVGIVRALGAPYLEPKDPRKSWSVRLGAVRELRRPVPFAEMRDAPGFEKFDVFRIGRLSVAPVPDPLWKRVLALERVDPDA
ncbi:MAG TPA: EVE domain-containing protein [Thermoplasmata archaeon]|nr:EVE domain-containing protein [Thermoplasmata archaeon]